MLYDLKVPYEKGYYDLFVETKERHSLQELKDLLQKANISEDLKENIDFITDMSIERLEMKDFLIKNGLKVIELKESDL